MAAEWIVVGDITAPQGVKGEVRLFPVTDFPERLLHMQLCHVRLRSGEVISYRVQHVRPHKGFFLLQLEGITDRDSAEFLRNAVVVIPQDEATPLPEGRYYVFDLIGMQVTTHTGTDVGVLKDVIPGPGNDVYVVQRPGQADALIPAVHQIVKSIDVPHKSMVIIPIPGLLDEGDEEGELPDEN